MEEKISEQEETKPQDAIEQEDVVVENEAPEVEPATPEELGKAAEIYTKITGKNDSPKALSSRMRET